MNILFFSTRIIYGGGEKVRNWLARELSLSGHTVTYAIPNLNENHMSQLEQVGLRDVIKVVSSPYNLKKRHPLKYMREIRSLYDSNHIDLIIMFGGSLVEQLIAQKSGVKILLSERFYNNFRPLASRILKQIQYRFSDGYVFQTQEASELYGNRAKRICTIIPNPIIDELPTPIFSNLRKEIVNTGRLCKQKDQATLIKAFSIFHKTHMDYKLIIYGSGEKKKDLQKLVSRLQLDECVKIISGKTNISTLINGAELFVLSSLAEGMPNALIEAMSMGVLSISTDCPVYGSRMLIEDGVNGFLVPVGNIDALAEKMIEAIDNKNQSDLIREKAVNIRKRLAPDIIRKQWIDYIAKMELREIEG